MIRCAGGIIYRCATVQDEAPECNGVFEIRIINTIELLSWCLGLGVAMNGFLWKKKRWLLLWSGGLQNALAGTARQSKMIMQGSKSLQLAECGECPYSEIKKSVHLPKPD